VQDEQSPAGHERSRQLTQHRPAADGLFFVTATGQILEKGAQITYVPRAPCPSLSVKAAACVANFFLL